MERADYEAQLNGTGEEEPDYCPDCGMRECRCEINDLPMTEEQFRTLIEAAYSAYMTRSLVNNWYPTGLARARRVA
jgi:hypothetical protein